jgi:hypothetical protein
MVQIHQILGTVAFLAMLPLPYKFYLAIRVALSLGSVICLIVKTHLDNKVRVALVILALVYNPFVPFHLSRTIWTCINFVSGIFLLKLDAIDSYMRLR